MDGIPISEYRDRVRKCQKLARSKRFDAILAYSEGRYSMGQGVESGENIRYFVGFTIPSRAIQERDVVVPYLISDSLLVIRQEGEPSLILSSDETERAKKQTWLSDVRTTTDDFLGAKYQGFAQITRDILHMKRNGKLGIGGTRVPMELHNELKRVFPRTVVSHCANELEGLRTVKSSNELHIMRKSAEIADEGVKALIETSRPGVAEYEVHQAVEKAMFEAGGDNPWSMIFTGPRAMMSYMSPDYTQRKIRNGDMVYADIGTELMGYHSDIQPAYIVGRGTADQVRIIETSLKMLKAMFTTTRPGATDTQVVKAACDTLKDNPFRNYMRTWSFGHGYGVGSDPPHLTAATRSLPRTKQLKLLENMVLCYEPGLFVPGVGGAALEDEVVVTRGGCQILTKCAERAEELLNQQKFR